MCDYLCTCTLQPCINTTYNIAVDVATYHYVTRLYMRDVACKTPYVELVHDLYWYTFQFNQINFCMDESPQAS